MDLKLESGRVIRKATEEDILSYVEGEEFAILSTGPNSYIHCAEQKEPPYEYILEYQDDSLKSHFRAVDELITLDRVLSAFIKYLRSDEFWRSEFRWEKMEL